MSLWYLNSWKRSLCAFATVIALMIMSSSAMYAASTTLAHVHVHVPTKDITVTTHATGRSISRISHDATDIPLPSTITLQTSDNPPLLLCYTERNFDLLIARGQPASTDPTCRFTLAQTNTGPGAGNVTLQASNNKYLTIDGASRKSIFAEKKTATDDSQFSMVELLLNHKFVFRASTGFYLNTMAFLDYPGGVLGAGAVSLDETGSQFTVKVIP